MSVFVISHKNILLKLSKYSIAAVALSTVLTGCSSQLKYEPRSVVTPEKTQPLANLNKPVKACSTRYLVKAGDTLSGIARTCELDMNRIAKANDLLPPYIIYVNQELDIPYPEEEKVYEKVQQPQVSRAITTENTPVEQNSRLPKISAAKPLEKKTQDEKSSRQPSSVEKENKVQPVTDVKQNNSVAEKLSSSSSSSKTAQALVRASKEPIYKNVEWQWPMHKGLAYKYRRDRAGLSVLEIYGIPGQDIFSVAPGKVVYAGNGIANYGWMVVVKHAGDYMSIYAHNSSLLVKEGDSVEAGEKIALLGATGNTKKPKLYLEARFQGRKYDIKKKLKHK